MGNVETKMLRQKKKKTKTRKHVPQKQKVTKKKRSAEIKYRSQVRVRACVIMATLHATTRIFFSQDDHKNPVSFLLISGVIFFFPFTFRSFVFLCG